MRRATLSSSSSRRRAGTTTALFVTQPKHQQQQRHCSTTTSSNGGAQTIGSLYPRPVPGLSNYSAVREHIHPALLQAAHIPLPADQQEIYEMSLLEWRDVDRSKLAGYKCSSPKAVQVADCEPLKADTSGMPADQKQIVEQCFDGQFFLHRGGVTEVAADAIVNAANEGCVGGGGVDGAIHGAAGPLLVRECYTFAGVRPACRTGHTRITKGYNLPARFVLHTVGPMGEKPPQLTSSYLTCFEMANRLQLSSIAFCCISTGIFGYPLINATRIAIDTALKSVYSQMHEGQFAQEKASAPKVVFACFKKEEQDAYEKLFPQVVAEFFEPKKEQQQQQQEPSSSGGRGGGAAASTGMRGGGGRGGDPFSSPSPSSQQQQQQQQKRSPFDSSSWFGRR